MNKQDWINVLKFYGLMHCIVFAIAALAVLVGCSLGLGVIIAIKILQFSN